MKKRSSAIVLLAILLLTGCGSSGPGQELNKVTGDIVKETPERTENTTESTEEASTEKPEGEAEEEKYYLMFEAVTVDGETWNSDRLADSKMTMINVWATYCNPCLAEMPDLGELAAEYDAADFQIIGVVSDVMEGDSAGNVDYAKELIAETKADYPHILLNESLYMSFVGAASAVPTTFFVRQDGSVIGYLTGAQSKENWKALIDQLLAEME